MKELFVPSLILNLCKYNHLSSLSASISYRINSSDMLLIKCTWLIEHSHKRTSFSSLLIWRFHVCLNTTQRRKDINVILERQLLLLISPEWVIAVMICGAEDPRAGDPGRKIQLKENTKCRQENKQKQTNNPPQNQDETQGCKTEL